MRTPLLSVNINKYALLRNSRGHDAPRLESVIDTVVEAGARGITIHPRLDQRHIVFDDVPRVGDYLARHHPDIEFNIECEDHPDVLDLVRAAQPHQCTLVPVTPGEITSDHGWTFPEHDARLRPLIEELKSLGIRVSLFADCDPTTIGGFATSGADRVELYTGPYAWAWGTPNQAQETARVFATARAAEQHGLGLNAGHDLDRHNLPGLCGLPGLLEVSIGHAQICRALEVGTRQSVTELLTALTLGPDTPPS